MTPQRDILLSDLPCGINAQIIGFEGGENFRSKLVALGLCEGKSFKKLCSVKLGGPVVIEINRAQIAIGKRMCQKIIVRAVDGK